MDHPFQEKQTVRPLVRLLQRMGIDRAVGFTVLGRGWAAASGLVTLLLLTHYLSPVQQGYYFTFGSVLALSVFLEMGLSLLLLQFASHERAHLEWTEGGILTGDSRAKGRLASLLQLSAKYYAVVGVIVAFTVLPLGGLFFFLHGSPGVHWLAPWIWVSLVSAITITLMPVLSVLEGCGLIAQIARLQLWQNIIGSLLLWLTLTFHWGLYAAPITNTVTLLCQILWIGMTKRAWLLDLLKFPAGEDRIDWKGEIWPLQWKIALSCVSGYFIFQLFNPILFATHGAAAAGQMGLSLAVMGTVSAISIAWIATKAATFGSLIARKDFAALDQLFFPCLWQSWALAAILSAVVWGIGAGAYAANLTISTRFLAPLPLGLLALVTVVSHGVFALAVYLRAHKQEPFLFLALASASLVALSSLLLSKPYGATGMMASYLVITSLGLSLGVHVFRQCRAQWHKPEMTLSTTGPVWMEKAADFDAE